MCALLVGFAVACAPESDGGTPAPGSSAGADPPPLYRATATVLQAPGRGAELCLGGIATSLPPQCGGPPITNWDWTAVDGEQSAQGVTWGEYLVTGTFDGMRFTVARPPTLAGPPATGFSGLATPCPEPHGGYVDRVPGRATPSDLSAAVALARQSPDLGGVWIDDPRAPRPDGSLRQGGTVLNASFTSDVDGHRARLEAVWGGYTCVMQASHTLGDLRRIQAELVASPPAGMVVLSAGVAEHLNRVEVGVVLATDDLKGAIDARHGPGTVELKGALQPVG